MEEVESLRIVVVDKESAAIQLGELGKSPHRFQDIFVEVDGWNCCILSNANLAWLMVFRFDGDAGFSTRNPLKSESRSSVKFRQSSGHIDDYPESWTFDRKEIFGAVAEFIRQKKFPESIHWNMDSEDVKQKVLRPSVWT